MVSTLAHAKPAQIAIVIDDIGYRTTDRQVLTIPGNITYAVLPQTPYGKRIAEEANRRNQDVILHIPMESTQGKKLGPGALTANMSEAAIAASLDESLQEVPFAIGINNHMGSHLTTLAKPMLWTMKFLKKRELLFLDSVTSPKSLGRTIADRMGVPAMSRHVFLDNQLSHQYIAGQFQQLINKAKRQQTAIAIAHPHPETVAALTKLIPQLKQHGIELVPLSALYRKTSYGGSLTASAE
ncbi:divergent polysaccharide deacetylase family protein [Thalassotalea euphylliae]|uniref:divergent polysaccharide deacetylase family protein n=1 Tax=Thalassotalea euphylliae TaxID=1655234 RepID=UPI002163F58C|nr:divergent polysaccharide deacetylase family protein [Thalassotalea euphylliae]